MRLTFREGAPLGAMYVVETASVSIATLMIGAFGTVALAGNQVAQSVGGVLYMLPLGVAGAVAIRVAQERGAQNLGALRPIALAAVLVAGLWLVTAAVVLVLQGEAIARLISDDPEVVAVAACPTPHGQHWCQPSPIGQWPCLWAMPWRIGRRWGHRAYGRPISLRWLGLGRH
jgi:Na+-driven multidrug efflux pump